MKRQGVGSREEGVEGGVSTRGASPRRPLSAGPTAAVHAATAKVTPARLAAFEVLKRVGEGKGHSDELLHSARVDALSPEDRNLTTTLGTGVVRWQLARDAPVRGWRSRPW